MFGRESKASVEVTNGLDPQIGNQDDASHSTIVSSVPKQHDPSVTFEEYLYYATLTRQEESMGSDSEVVQQEHQNLQLQNEAGDGGVVQVSLVDMAPQKDTIENLSRLGKNKTLLKTTTSSNELPLSTKPPIVTSEEWIQASRAARNATWGAVFYLITTDILGPLSAPWAIAQLGYGPGATLYIVLGGFAGFGGYLLWRMFLALDSHRYPLKNYGDLAFQVYGPFARHTVNVLQVIQLFVLVAIIMIGNGQALSQMVSGRLCYIICTLVWAIAGAILGQIRTLRKLGWLAHFSIWLNVFVIITTMVVVSHSKPNYVAALANNGVPEGPVITSADTSSYIGYKGQVVGFMQAAFAYAGAMLFIEFLAEMRRPYDFWKGMLFAQVFILCVYLLFGIFVYSQQGQFAINPANQGISVYVWQTITNAITLGSGLIVILLYSNVCVKVLYQNIGVELFSFPPLETKRGKLIWVGLTPVFWVIAFVIGSSIPQISNLSALLAAVCMVQFSYTFPACLMVGFNIQKEAILESESFDPDTGRLTRHDSGIKRWIRGYKKSWKLNTFNVLFCLCSLATAGLATYSAVELLISAYAANPNLVAFSCCSPVTGC